MPVNVLYCEGGTNSPDIRVIQALLPEHCVLKYAGTRYGLGRRILFLKQERSVPHIAVLRDRDFDSKADSPTNTPHEWFIHENDQTKNIGWYWERKEIENYLIDPVVIQHALGRKAPNDDEYRDALRQSAESLAVYTAARIALVLSSSTPPPLPNKWGIKQWGMLFPVPIDALDESVCRNEIHNIIVHYQQNQIIQETEVIHTFKNLLLECRPAGIRFQHYLTFFAGKDLLCGLKEALMRFNLGSPADFRERIVKGIENSPEDVWTWLPEWQKLRELISS